MTQELHEPRENDQAEMKMEGLPLNDEIGDLFDDNTLNQQVFSKWSYSQRIRAMRSVERLIKENSRQGKRSDLDKTQVDLQDEVLPIDSRHKLGKKSRRATTRDRIADRLGIATATLSKYRNIGKLPDNLIDVLGRLLDDRTITFEAAYQMSGLMPCDVRALVKYIEESSDKKIDSVKLKELCARRKGLKEGITPVLSRDDLKGILVSKPIILPVIHQK